MMMEKIYLEIGDKAINIEVGRNTTSLVVNDERINLTPPELYRLDTAARMLLGVIPGVK